MYSSRRQRAGISPASAASSFCAAFVFAFRLFADGPAKHAMLSIKIAQVEKAWGRTPSSLFLHFCRKDFRAALPASPENHREFSQPSTESSSLEAAFVSRFVQRSFKADADNEDKPSCLLISKNGWNRSPVPNRLLSIPNAELIYPDSLKTRQKVLADDSGVIAPTIPEISRPPIPGLSRPPVPEICRPPIPELIRPPVAAV